MILMTLGQDEQKDANISTVRAAAGSAGGKQTQANASKRKQNEQTEANESICSNKNKEEEKDIKENPLKGVKEKPLARFTPPTVDDVALYCQERGNAVNAQRFVDFYAAKGWKIGQNPMKDWKAAVRTWEQRDESTGRPAKVVSAQQYGQRNYTEAELLSVSDDLMAEARARRDSA